MIFLIELFGELTGGQPDSVASTLVAMRKYTDLLSIKAAMP